MALEKAKANPTTYILTNHRLVLKTGIVGKKEDQIDLFRVKDIRVAQGIKERAMGIGHIEVISTDSSSPKLVLEGIKDPNVVKELIWGAVKKAKGGRGVLYME